MRAIRRALLPATVVIFLLLPLRVHAEPIVVTSGFLTSTGLSGVGHFDLVGAGFRVAGTTDIGLVSPSMCFPCSPGDVVDLSVDLSGRLDLDGQALIDGASAGSLFDGGFFFDAGSITIPANPEDFSVVRPFTFSGTLQGLDETGQHTIFTRALSGRGTMGVAFRAIPVFEGVEGVDFVSILFDFESADPVPEPFTLMLVGSGLGGIALRVRMRRTRNG